MHCASFHPFWPVGWNLRALALATSLSLASSDDKTGNYIDHWVDKSSYAGVGNKETVLSLKFNYTGDYDGNEDGNRFVVMLGLRTNGDV